MVFFSDGIVEAENGRGEMFGYERMAQAIRRGCGNGAGAEKLLDGIVEEMRDFAGDAPQADDLTVVALMVEK